MTRDDVEPEAGDRPTPTPCYPQNWCIPAVPGCTSNHPQQRMEMLSQQIAQLNAAVAQLAAMQQGQGQGGAMGGVQPAAYQDMQQPAQSPQFPGQQQMQPPQMQQQPGQMQQMQPSAEQVQFFQQQYQQQLLAQQAQYEQKCQEMAAMQAQLAETQRQYQAVLEAKQLQVTQQREARLLHKLNGGQQAAELATAPESQPATDPRVARPMPAVEVETPRHENAELPFRNEAPPVAVDQVLSRNVGQYRWQPAESAPVSTAREDVGRAQVASTAVATTTVARVATEKAATEEAGGNRLVRWIKGRK